MWQRGWLLLGALVVGLVGIPLTRPALAAELPHVTTPVGREKATALACQRVIVQSGDTLSRMAERLHLAWMQLYAENRAVIGPNPNRIVPGEVLTVCQAGAPPPVAPSPSAGEPCQSHVYWPSGRLTTWAAPPGCYAQPYGINPARYPRVAEAFGGCDWWPAALHPTLDIWSAPRHLQPRVGAAILFASHEQGAGVEGHWGIVVAISPDGRYVLSSEMNSTIYGRFPYPIGGWGRVIYRFVRVDGWRTLFVY